MSAHTSAPAAHAVAGTPRIGFGWWTRFCGAWLVMVPLSIMLGPLLLMLWLIVAWQITLGVLTRDPAIKGNPLVAFLVGWTVIPLLFSGLAVPFLLFVRMLLAEGVFGKDGAVTFLVQQASLSGLSWLLWAAAAVGLVEALGLFVSLATLWRKRLQIRNIPRAKARSVAVGLAELRGVARAAPPDVARPETDTQDVPLDLRSVIPEGAIVFRGRGKDRLGREPRVTHWNRFYLEDETGRILVDPRGVDFWEGENEFAMFGQPLSVLHLPTHRLMPGDPVFLLGSVEINRDAAPAAADGERLVVRAAPARRGGRAIDRTLRGLAFRLFGPRRVFFLSTSSECEGLRQLEISLVDTTALGLYLLVCSLTLLLW